MFSGKQARANTVQLMWHWTLAYLNKRKIQQIQAYEVKLLQFTVVIVNTSLDNIYNIGYGAWVSRPNQCQ